MNESRDAIRECPFKRAKLNEHDSVHTMDDQDQELKHKLRQFQVLDEIQDEGSGSDGEHDGSNSDYSYDSADMEFNDEDIERMLDEGLPDDLKNKRRENQYEEKYKFVLEEKGHNHFEVLPEGWVETTHNSGIPLFLHRSSRVCTASRPYFLGPGSVRKHAIPLNAIPCLAYRTALDKETEMKNKLTLDTVIGNGQETSTEEVPINENANLKNGVPSSHQPKPKFPHAKIETVTENLRQQSLSSEQITAYCRKLFRFKTIRVMRFKSWSARRKFTKKRKHIKNLQRPTLPDGTKLITFPVLTQEGDNVNSSRPKKEWIMNPNGKSYVCILHEYVQHALKKQPTYEFKELENAATPYSATVLINDLKYSTGYGTSKKHAKSEAARETLEVLIPEMRDKISADTSNSNTKSNPIDHYKDLSVFDEIKIEDPRVAEFCAKTTEPPPHAILITCLQRNFGLGDIQIKYQVNTVKHKKNEFKMTVGKHTATVVCRNKRDGKQRASQAILQILHPHITTWGSLLRLYGNHSVKSFKEKKQEEQEITVLQSKATVNQPNLAILNKLKLEMNKLRERNQSVKTIGTFVPPCDVDLPTATGSNLRNVDL